MTIPNKNKDQENFAHHQPHIRNDHHIHRNFNVTSQITMPTSSYLFTQKALVRVQDAMARMRQNGIYVGDANVIEQVEWKEIDNGYTIFMRRNKKQPRDDEEAVLATIGVILKSIETNLASDAKWRPDNRFNKALNEAKLTIALISPNEVKHVNLKKAFEASVNNCEGINKLVYNKAAKQNTTYLDKSGKTTLLRLRHELFVVSNHQLLIQSASHIELF